MTFRGNLQALGLAAFVALFVSADALMAQQGRGGGRGGFGDVTQLTLLTQEGIQKDLELVDDQIKGIERGRDQAREKMREMFMNVREDMQGLSDDERREKIEEIRSQMTTMNEEIENDVLAELLPHQVERLQQLMVQAQTRRGGGATGGKLSPILIEKLDMDEEQQEKLKKKAEEVSQKLNAQIQRLRSEAQDEILTSVLSKEQYAQFKELNGEQYDFEADGAQQQNRFGGRGGDQGGRGGDQGGRGGRGGDQGGRGGRGGDRGGDRGGRGGGDNNSNATESDFNAE